MKFRKPKIVLENSPPGEYRIVSSQLKSARMKFFFTLIAVTFIFSFKADCQITKGNWLAGGSGSFNTQQGLISTVNVKSYTINLSPDIGYFFADKFAGGLKPNIAYRETINYGSKNKSTYLGIGPFVRYYFLPVENRVNILAEGAYQYATEFNGFIENDFSFSLGPVIYFNSSVGLEITLNYDKINSQTTNVKTFSLGIGFQIHLEKEKIN